MTMALLSALLGAAGALVALLIGARAMAIGEALGLLDQPDHAGGRKLHSRTTPLVGGIAFALAFAIGAIALLFWPPAAGLRAPLAGLLFMVMAAFSVGIIDDRRNLGPAMRLGVMGALLLLLLALIPDYRVSELYFGFQTRPLALPLPLWVAFTLLCILGLQNAVNMADGKNGLVIGQAIIWTAVLAVRLPAPMLPLLSALGGALGVLFLFNYRGKLFLGDGGSYGIATSFGLIAILAWSSSATMRSDDIAIIFALPVFDTLRVIAQRKLQGRSAFMPGRDHLHHYLHDRWPWPRPLPFVLLLVAVPNLSAILMPGTGWIWLLVTALGYTLMLLLAARSRQAGPA